MDMLDKASTHSHLPNTDEFISDNHIECSMLVTVRRMRHVHPPELDSGSCYSAYTTGNWLANASAAFEAADTTRAAFSLS